MFLHKWKDYVCGRSSHLIYVTDALFQCYIKEESHFSVHIYPYALNFTSDYSEKEEVGHRWKLPLTEGFLFLHAVLLVTVFDKDW